MPADNKNKGRPQTRGATDIPSQTWLLLAIVGIALIAMIGVWVSPTNVVPILGFCSMITITLLQLLQGIRAASSAEEVRTELKTSNKEQAANLAEQSDKIDTGLRIQRATHTLVNEKTSKKLNKIVDLAKEVYSLQPTQENLIKLREAEHELAEHLSAQAEVDAEYGEEAKKMGTKHGEKNG